METINLVVSRIYDKTINHGMHRVIEIKLDPVKSHFGIRAMFTRGNKIKKKKGEIVNIEDLKTGDVICATVGV